MAEESELGSLARLWYDGWQDAHKLILPPQLARHRTLESLGFLLRSSLGNVRTTGSAGHPVGFSLVKGDELNQLYVSRESRGTGIAAALLSDAEARLSAAGIGTAWLACAIGNDRASRFYEKHGWRCVGKNVIHLDIPEGTFPLETWRYEKDV